jgi:hypothetical protein
MPRPPNPSLLSWTREIQSPAGISLERVHDKLRRNVRIDHDVHVVRAHLRREQTPPFVSADFKDRSESNGALISIQLERFLLKQGFHVLAKLGLRLRQPGTRHVMVAVRCALLAREMRSVTGERNEIGGDDKLVTAKSIFSQEILSVYPLPDGRGSVWFPLVHPFQTPGAATVRERVDAERCSGLSPRRTAQIVIGRNGFSTSYIALSFSKFKAWDGWPQEESLFRDHCR